MNGDVYRLQQSLHLPGPHYRVTFVILSICFSIVTFRLYNLVSDHITVKAFFLFLPSPSNIY